MVFTTDETARLDAGTGDAGSDAGSDVGGDAERGQDLLVVLTALAHPQRLRIVAALADGRNYVSQLARELQMSRPLLHMHLARLEAAGLVQSKMEVSDDRKAMRYVEVVPFTVQVTPRAIAEVVANAGRSTPVEQPEEDR